MIDDSILKDKEIKSISIIGKVPYNPNVTLGRYSPFEPDGTLLNHTIFDGKTVKLDQPISATWTIELAEAKEPTRLDKIRNKITSLFHPITKYRIRIVNTDYDCYDD